MDDSNIWIEAKKLAGKKRQFKTGEDHRVRIDIGKLTDVVAAGRTVEQGFLYGSEPPAIDEVWEKIRKHGWAVDTKKRQRTTGKEKKVDTQIAVDIVTKAFNTPLDKRSTIILITGDADLLPAIEGVLKCEGWRVEVYMWKQALSRDLKALTDDRVVVEPLDEYLERVTFTNMKFNLHDNRHLLPQVQKCGVVFSMTPNAFPRHQPTRTWCRRLESIAQWPFQYYWFDQQNHLTNDLVLVFTSRLKDSKKPEFDVKGFIDTIKDHPLPNVERVETFIQYTQKQSKLTETALQTVGRFSFDDVFEGSDNETNDSWTLAQSRSVSKRRRRPLYSDPCPYGFNCKYGVACYYQHTQKEKQIFRANMGRGNPFRKVKPCSYYPHCLRKAEDCQYAHGEEDAYCQICMDYVGHYTENCPTCAEPDT